MVIFVTISFMGDIENVVRKRGRNHFKFTEKVHSKKGIVALFIAAVLLVLYVVIVYRAFSSEGKLSAYYGSAGIFSMIVSLVTFVLAIQSTMEEDSFQFFPRMAVVVSFVVSVCWIGTYVIGFM